MYYKINHGSVELSGKTILEDINFSVTDNEHIGIVGANGCGKTTFLKALIGEIELTDGYDKLEIEKTSDFKIGYVKQNMDIDFNITMLDYILSAYDYLIKIENNLRKLEEEIQNNYNDKALDKYNKLILDYEYNGGYNYKKEYEVALKKFNFTDSDKLKKMSEFSSGQRTKLSFIKLLLSKPDLLILDEPTNHLDITTIEWLEEYLSNYKKSIILVSHDQMFLDNVCNVIYDISFGTFKRYSGNYSYYVKQKEFDYNKALKDYEAQQKEIKRLMAIADRFRYKPSKASMAMSKLHQVEKMNIIDKPNKESNKTFRINFNPDLVSYKDVLKVKNLIIGYDKPLYTVTFNVLREDKLGIIGANGIGKSTLLKTIIGQIPSLGGKYVYGDNIKLAYFSQNLENLNVNNTIYEEIDNTFKELSPLEIRTLLGSFEFHGEDVFKYIKDLSGGEKVRVSLAKILYTKPNLLILDEPTNHLDINSKNTILNMLNDYKGTIIMVSHDRYLIKNVCNKLLVFDTDSVDFYNYGYSEYQDKRKKKIDIAIKEESKPKEKKEYINTNKEISKLERKIDKLEEELKQLNQELFKEEVYKDTNKLNEIEQKINNINIQIEENTAKWEKLVSNNNS